MVSGDGVAEWFKALDLKYGSPWFILVHPWFILHATATWICSR